MVIQKYPLKQWNLNVSNYDMEGNLCLSEQQDILCTMPCVADHCHGILKKGKGIHISEN